MIDGFTVNLCDPLQFDDVQPPFTEFAFRDEGVRLAQTPGDLFLQITCIVPGFYQTFQERLISSLVCCIAFVHKMRVRDCRAIPQNREWLIEGHALDGPSRESKNDRRRYESLLFGIPRDCRQNC